MNNARSINFLKNKEGDDYPPDDDITIDVSCGDIN